jgi:hypothetical protein
MFAEDGQGFVEASSGPQGFDGLMEDEAEAGGFTPGPAEELGGGIGPEPSVVLAGPAGDGLGDHSTTGQASGFGGEFEPATIGGIGRERG